MTNIVTVSEEIAEMKIAAAAALTAATEAYKRAPKSNELSQEASNYFNALSVVTELDRREEFLKSAAKKDKLAVACLWVGLATVAAGIAGLYYEVVATWIGLTTLAVGALTVSAKKGINSLYLDDVHRAMGWSESKVKSASNLRSAEDAFTSAKHDLETAIQRVETTTSTYRSGTSDMEQQERNYREMESAKAKLLAAQAKAASTEAAYHAADRDFNSYA